MPPRPLQLAPGPHTDDVEELPWTLDMVGRVAKSAATKVATLAKDHDKSAEETVKAIDRLREDVGTGRAAAIRAHAAASEARDTAGRVERNQQALVTSIGGLTTAVDALCTETRSIGGGLADLEAYLVVRDARTARKTAITTSSLTGGVIVVASVILKLIFGV